MRKNPATKSTKNPAAQEQTPAKNPFCLKPALGDLRLSAFAYACLHLLAFVNTPPFSTPPFAAHCWEADTRSLKVESRMDLRRSSVPVLGAHFWGLNFRKSKWGLSTGGLSPPPAICTQSSTIVHFCAPFGPLSTGSFRRRMTTIVGNRGQLWTSTLSPHLLSPHLDFPKPYGPKSWKISRSLEIFKIAWNFQSRLKFSILTSRIPHEK